MKRIDLHKNYLQVISWAFIPGTSHGRALSVS
jgi:hypothetical protein